eukprot:2192798-Prymnesium_polylepis.1
MDSGSPSCGPPKDAHEQRADPGLLSRSNDCFDRLFGPSESLASSRWSVPWQHTTRRGPCKLTATSVRVSDARTSERHRCIDRTP